HSIVQSAAERRVHHAEDAFGRTGGGGGGRWRPPHGGGGGGRGGGGVPGGAGGGAPGRGGVWERGWTRRWARGLAPACLAGGRRIAALRGRSSSTRATLDRSTSTDVRRASNGCGCRARIHRTAAVSSRSSASSR